MFPLNPSIFIKMSHQHPIFLNQCYNDGRLGTVNLILSVGVIRVTYAIWIREDRNEKNNVTSK